MTATRGRKFPGPDAGCPANTYTVIEAREEEEGEERKERMDPRGDRRRKVDIRIEKREQEPGRPAAAVYTCRRLSRFLRHFFATFIITRKPMCSPKPRFVISGIRVPPYGRVLVGPRCSRGEAGWRA
ncbi:hypothetical protein KM043_018157 [Ampulex compressa]|nr:hypothetical protein KM043_018157 [Ampulex compressa]